MTAMILEELNQKMESSDKKKKGKAYNIHNRG